MSNSNSPFKNVAKLGIMNRRLSLFRVHPGDDQASGPQYISQRSVECRVFDYSTYSGRTHIKEQVETQELDVTQRLNRIVYT